MNCHRRRRAMARRSPGLFFQIFQKVFPFFLSGKRRDSAVSRQTSLKNISGKIEEGREGQRRGKLFLFVCCIFPLFAGVIKKISLSLSLSLVHSLLSLCWSRTTKMWERKTEANVSLPLSLSLPYANHGSPYLRLLWFLWVGRLSALSTPD